MHPKLKFLVPVLFAFAFVACKPDCVQLKILLDAAKASGNQTLIDSAQKAYDDGKCAPAPPADCRTTKCPEGQECLASPEGVWGCVTIAPPEPKCPESCPAGQECKDPKIGCVLIPPPPAPVCAAGADLVENEVQGPAQLQGKVAAAIASLPDPVGIAPAITLEKLAAKLREGGLCAFAGIEAVFVRRVDGRFEEYHAVYFGNGGWTDSGNGKYIGLHRLKTDPIVDGCGAPAPPPFVRIDGKVHNAFCANIDTTGKVSGRTYCESVGFLGRDDCPVRQEGAADRVACEARLRGYKPLVWSGGPGMTVSPCAVEGNCVCGPDSYVNSNPWQASLSAMAS